MRLLWHPIPILCRAVGHGHGGVHVSHRVSCHVFEEAEYGVLHHWVCEDALGHTRIATTEGWAKGIRGVGVVVLVPMSRFVRGGQCT